MFMYFTYFYTCLCQSIWFFGSVTNWAIAQLGNHFNFPTQTSLPVRGTIWQCSSPLPLSFVFPYPLICVFVLCCSLSCVVVIAVIAAIFVIADHQFVITFVLMLPLGPNLEVWPLGPKPVIHCRRGWIRKEVRYPLRVVGSSELNEASGALINN